VADTNSLPTTIDEVIERLDEIIGWSVLLKNRAGFFAVLYLHVTLAVKDGVANGRFEFPDLMQRLDVVFANRYLQALEANSEHPELVTRSWRIAFDMLSDDSISILQHLLLGMNAHINLDLAIAAAEISTANEIDKTKGDFFEITTLLLELTEKVTDALIDVSPKMSYFYRLGGIGGPAAQALLRITRGEAWEAALRIVALQGEARIAEVVSLDSNVSRLGEEIARPPSILGWVFRTMAADENKGVPVVIRAIRRQLAPAPMPPAQLAERAASKSKTTWTGPTSLWEAGLWIVWPFYLRRRRLFYALLVVIGIAAAGVTVWANLSQSVRTRIVDTLLLALATGDKAYGGVQITEQYTTLDLTEVRTIPPGKENDKWSLAKWKIDMKGTKVSMSGDLFGNRSGTTSPVDPDFYCSHPIRITPTTSTVGNVSYRRWDVFADISKLNIDEEFEVIFRVNMWNAFQKDHEDATCSCLHISPRMTFDILFPRPSRDHKFYVVLQDPKSAKMPVTLPDYQLLDNGRRLIWVISSPRLNHGYRLEWDW
jgi:hypothetical protein